MRKSVYLPLLIKKPSHISDFSCTVMVRFEWGGWKGMLWNVKHSIGKSVGKDAACETPSERKCLHDNLFLNLYSPLLHFRRWLFFNLFLQMCFFDGLLASFVFFFFLSMLLFMTFLLSHYIPLFFIISVLFLTSCILARCFISCSFSQSYCFCCNPRHSSLYLPNKA